jgi:hypothetical protein
LNLICEEEVKIKRPWETGLPAAGREATHGLHFNSNGYNGAGQTSITFFSQHHQLLFFNRKISSTLIIPL